MSGILSPELEMPACPGATGCEYTTVFTDYECLTLQHRILPCQVWARGLGQGSQIAYFRQSKSEIQNAQSKINSLRIPHSEIRNPKSTIE